MHKSSHRRRDSNELDVVEADLYFSSHYEKHPATTATPTLPQNLHTKHTPQPWRGRRVSLDIPLRHHHHCDHHQMPPNATVKHPKDPKKYKHPNSPGGKLASFLNSLFNQAVLSKKKKSKSTTTTQSMKDHIEEESPGGWRRKRRSSISHLRTTTTVTATVDPTPISGFRTPPHLENLSKYKINTNNASNLKSWDWLQDEKLKIKEKNGDDEGGLESDSSSDLFELRLDYDDLGFYSSGLPVYESTHLENIKRSSSTSISNVPMKV